MGVMIVVLCVNVDLNETLHQLLIILPHLNFYKPIYKINKQTIKN